LVGGHAVVKHPGIGAAMERQIGLPEQHAKLVTFMHYEPLYKLAFSMPRKYSL
jgi:hypothetical protein